MDLRSEQTVSGGGITIILPCKDQLEKFLAASLDSVLNQELHAWKLLVVVDVNTPDNIQKLVAFSARDSRISMLVCHEQSMASAINMGMRHAETEFVCLLLSDDAIDKSAVRVLDNYIRRYPDVDFFHSSRRFIDGKGNARSEIMRSKKEFSPDHFKQYGSPVKHLMCWRRQKGLDIGGMDTDVQSHGCDDYDFPWRMAEAGCKFMAVDECLYYYRVHHEFYRLTTNVPLQTQVTSLRTMFRKHGVPNGESENYIRRAVLGYLLRDKALNYE